MINLRSVPFISVGLSLLLLLAQGSYSLTLQRSEPFQSQKAPAETITKYSVVLPVISNSTNAEDGGHPVEFTLVVKDFLVHLVLNRGLFPAHFTSKHFDEQGEEVITHGHVNCFYQGWVEGHPEWKATMSTCHGLRGSFGDRSNPDKFYHIEPLYHGNTKINQPHAFYLDSEYTTRESNCGTPHTHKDSNLKPNILSDHDDLLGDSRNRLRRQNSLGELIVEWAVFNDRAQYERYGSEVEPTVQRAIEIANYLDMLYRNEYMIRIVIVYVETWSTGDRISISTVPSTLLDNFEQYSITAHHDSAMLMTSPTSLSGQMHTHLNPISGVNLDGNTVGIANIRAMCGQFSRGLTQDTGRSIEGTGSTAAHELGHIFNMEHDDSPRACSCNDPSGNCIMAAVSGNPPPSVWSTCSREDLQAGFNQFGLSSCLTNEPAVFVGDPVCGNGLKEEGEACDCGSEELCPDPCCNATSCQLAEGAQCFSGGCCNECQFRPYGFSCRGSTHECDITDYCSGDSSECPEDARIQNGQICNNNMSYCFSGACQTYDSQCQTYFGTNNGITQCYTVYNERGDQFGNCGHAGGDYLPCATEDVFCGQRFCEFGDLNNNIGGVSILTVFAFDDNRVQQRCRAITIPPTSDTTSPGLVNDGTRCGDDQLCSLSRCVPLSSLNIPPCPSGLNGQVCSGNGQCNSENQCSCFVGFAGSTCESIVSIASGPSGGGIAGGIIGALIGIGVTAAVVIVVVVFVVLKKKDKKHSYPPSSRSQKPLSEHRPSNNGSRNVSQPVTSVAIARPSAPPPTYPASSHHSGHSSQQQRRPPPPSRTAPAKPPPGPPLNVARPSRPPQPNTDPTSRRNIHPTRPPAPGTRPPPPKPAKSDVNLSRVNDEQVKPPVAVRPTPAPRPQPPTKPRVNVPTSKQPPVPRKPMVPPKK